MGKIEKMPETQPHGWQDGPILTLLKRGPDFDVLYLLCDERLEQTGHLPALKGVLSSAHPRLKVIPERIPLRGDPRDYEILYRYMRAVCETARSRHGDKASYDVFLSPGTPQMHAIWVLLTKTVFKATTWQSTEYPLAPSAEIVQVPFDIEAELVEPAIAAAKCMPPAVREGALIYASAAMNRAVGMATRAAQSDQPILIIGETGTGKEGLARLVHERSPRRRLAPFVEVNCGALPPALADSELFGHEKGAFTGADRQRIGLFEQAQGGTIFLDEIGELAPDIQVRLLRVLQQKQLRRVGSHGVQVALNIRVVAATNVDLAKAVRTGTFREDLYYRINTITVNLPPLRERPEDTACLLEHFTTIANARRATRGVPTFRFSRTAASRLLRYPWPGNVREMENVVVGRFGAVLDGTTIGLSAVEEALGPSMSNDDLAVYIPSDATLEEALCVTERHVLARALQRHGSQRLAAAALKIGKGMQQNFARRWARVHGTRD